MNSDLDAISGRKPEYPVFVSVLVVAIVGVGLSMWALLSIDGSSWSESGMSVSTAAGSPGGQGSEAFQYGEVSCAVDNCPHVFNPEQEDRDGDGVGDVCDDHPDEYSEDGC